MVPQKSKFSKDQSKYYHTWELKFIKILIDEDFEI